MGFAGGNSHGSADLAKADGINSARPIVGERMDKRVRLNHWRRGGAIVGLLAGGSLLSLAGVASGAGVGMSAPEDAADAEPAKVRAALVAEFSALVPGEVNTLAITLEIEPGWHVYWRGLNDTGFPVSAEWSLPEGFEVGTVAWPAPHRHVAPGDILDYVYEDRVTLLVPITVPESAAPGTVIDIRADVTWLVCKGACVPEDAALALAVPVAKAGETVKPTEAAQVITEARRRLPRALTPEQRDLALSWEGDTLTIAPSGSFAWAAFYPRDDSMAIASPIRDGLVKAGPLRLRLDRDAPGEATRLIGIVEVKRREGGASEVFEIDVPAP